MSKISVCIATFNGEKYIEQQLVSILSQLDSDDEVIISDDGSTDKTLDIIKKINDNRIVLFANNNFKNPIYNIENTLVKASGDHIFLSDQDDVWLPNKVNTLKKHLKKYDLVISDAFVVDENLNILKDSFFALNNSQAGIIKNLLKNSYLGCCMAFNSNLLSTVLPFPKSIPMHDWWIGLIAEYYGKTLFCEDKLIYYRRHGKNASATSEKSPNSFCNKIIFRVLLMYNLILRLTK